MELPGLGEFMNQRHFKPGTHPTSWQQVCVLQMLPVTAATAGGWGRAERGVPEFHPRRNALVQDETTLRAFAPACFCLTKRHRFSCTVYNGKSSKEEEREAERKREKERKTENKGRKRRSLFNSPSP